MFRLSKAAEYSIRGLLHLSIHYSEDKLCDIDEIAKSTDTPPAYLAKLLQLLVRKGFVKSFKGQKGGFALTRQPKDIKLLDVIEAMEGPIFLNYCLIYEGYCDRDKFCSVHDVWAGAQKVLIDYLGGCSFEQLVKDAIAKKESLMK
ncbi:MAG: Rrf2 family transcriptional regulator [Nitrospirae bacterium]|nr:Rrf2 family transcriptional regulator [Nitrospirota bacterium]